MKSKLDLAKGTVSSCSMQVMQNAITILLGHMTGCIILQAAAGLPPPGDWINAQYLVVETSHQQNHCEKLVLKFHETGKNGSERILSYTVLLLPAVRATVVFELKHLDLQTSYPALVPGTLKSGIRGSSIRINAISKMTIGLDTGFFENRTLIIHDLYLTRDKPELTAMQTTNTDKFGQWKQKEWPGKITSETQLADVLVKEYQDSSMNNRPPDWDQYGGWQNTCLQKSGYFRVEKKDDRWWLIDPDGHIFFSTGVFGVYPGEPGWIYGNEAYFDWLPERDGKFTEAWTKAENCELYRRKFHGKFPDDTMMFSFGTANLIRAFGSDWYEKWTKITRYRLAKLGINTLSMFSDQQFVRDSGWPFVIMLKGYPTTRISVFREFPDVFSDEYVVNCDCFASQLSEYVQNRNLIGYFLNNEPTWGFINDLILAEKVLEMETETDCRTALIDFLRYRYQDNIAALNSAWHIALCSFADLRRPLMRAADLSKASHRDLSDFSDKMIARYAEVPAKYARRYAPNHLNLGMRFASTKNERMLQTHQYFDVFSFNCYQEDASPSVRSIADRIDKPMMIGEFHFGALDRGLPSPGLFAVADQTERGRAYARYMDRIAAEPQIIGAHYFAWNDQPLWGRYDGENYQIGFVDICNQEYSEFTKLVAHTNRSIYTVLAGERTPYPGITQRFVGYGRSK